MSRIAIITDGSLVPEENSPADSIVPFYVLYQDPRGNQRSISGQEVSQEEFLAIQKECKKPPKTSLPSPGDFYTTLTKLWENGFREFLVLTAPKSKSGTFGSAIAGKEEFCAVSGVADSKVVVIDSGTTVAGVKDMAKLARDMRYWNETLPSIEKQLVRLSKRIEIFLTTDTIVYLGDSGRVEELGEGKRKDTIKNFGIGLATYFARVAHRSPKLVLTFKEGKEKIVTLSRFYPSAVDRMFREIEERELTGKNLCRVYLYQSQSEIEAKRLRGQLELLTHAELIEETQIPLALLATTGPKLVAAVCIYE